MGEEKGKRKFESCRREYCLPVLSVLLMMTVCDLGKCCRITCMKSDHGCNLVDTGTVLMGIRGCVSIYDNMTHFGNTVEGDYVIISTISV